MSAIAFLQQLLDAGIPLEAAMTAARLHEEAMGSVVPTTKAAERTRRWRERKASQTVTDRHETSRGDACDANPLPLPSSPQTPQQPTPTPRDITTPARKGPDLTAGFAVFWSAYPRKKSKDAAVKAFAKAMRRITEDDPLAVILAGIERALPGWDDPQFIPHPATWLNAAGWEDEAPTIRPVTPQRPRNERPDRYTAQQDNLAAAWTGSERASEIVAARRAFGSTGD